MSAKIYYFSGTGNSLAVARTLGKLLVDEYSIEEVSKFQGEQRVTIDTDILGIVFPVYCLNVPDIVKAFVEKLSFKTKPYIFAIATCNGQPGHSLFTLNNGLSKKGQRLSLGFVIDMPGNAVVTPHEIEIERLKASKGRIAEIARLVNNKTVSKPEGQDDFKSHIKGFVVKVIGKKVAFAPKKFSVSDSCVGCGTCQKVCPVSNIKLVNERPEWGKHCETCLACFHWCPKKAVKIGESFSKRGRYHHPEVSVEDMKH